MDKHFKPYVNDSTTKMLVVAFTDTSYFPSEFTVRNIVLSMTYRWRNVEGRLRRTSFTLLKYYSVAALVSFKVAAADLTVVTALSSRGASFPTFTTFMTASPN